MLAIVSGEFVRADATPLPGTGTSIETIFLTTHGRLARFARESLQAFTTRRNLPRIKNARSVVLAAAGDVSTTRTAIRQRARTTDAVSVPYASAAVEAIVFTFVFRTILPLERRGTFASNAVYLVLV